jgi:hypothetical protein
MKIGMGMSYFLVPDKKTLAPTISRMGFPIFSNKLEALRIKRKLCR